MDNIFRYENHQGDIKSFKTFRLRPMRSEKSRGVSLSPEMVRLVKETHDSMIPSIPGLDGQAAVLDPVLCEDPVAHAAAAVVVDPSQIGVSGMIHRIHGRAIEELKCYTRVMLIRTGFA